MLKLIFFCFIFIEKPTFDIGFVKDIVVKKGQNYEIHIPYKATPRPTAEWTLNDKEVAQDDRIKVIVSKIVLLLTYCFYLFKSTFKVLDNVVTLVNHDSQRSDTGIWKLTLRNREGGNSTTVRVTVLGLCVFFFCFDFKFDSLPSVLA